MTASSCRRGICLPRAESRQRADDDLRGRRRLRSFRESPRRSRRAVPDATVGLLPDAQSLAPGRLAARGWRAVAVRRLVDTDAHSTLACPSSFARLRPRVSGAVQVVPDPRGRPSVRRCAVRRAECTAGKTGPAGRAMALGQPLPLVALQCRRPEVVGDVARATQAQLGCLRQFHANGGRVLKAVRRSVLRGNPFGDESWSDRAVRRLGLESTLRSHGRPKKAENGS